MSQIGVDTRNVRPTWEDGDDEARSGVVGVTTPPPGQWPPPPPPSPQGPPWGPQPSGPTSGGAAKWILGGLVLLVVVVITVVATLIFAVDKEQTSPPSASETSSEQIEASDVASATDRGPAAIITDDPTCSAWEPIADTLAQQEAKGWNDRNVLVPASNWTPAQRAQHEEVARAMRSAADQTTVLAKSTPHRLMRELYEQSIAYWRSYADRIPNYEPADDNLARVATSTSNALVWICAAITYKSAEARSPFVVAAPAPLNFAPIGDGSEPQWFLPHTVGVCNEWHATVAKFTQETEAWLAIDPNLNASQWTPQQQMTYTSTALIMESNAATLQDLGIRSGNPIFQDFATLAAQYRRAYVSAIPSYTPSDNYLASVASQLVAAIDAACSAAE